MTNKQYRILKCVARHGKLNHILKALKGYNYRSLQDAVGPGMIVFSDSNMDENTTLWLSDKATELYEDRKHRNFSNYFTRTIAIWGAITGTIALLLNLWKCFL